MKYNYLKSFRLYESEMSADLNTMQKINREAKKQKFNLRDEDDLVEFIYKNFKRITGEEFEDMGDFMIDDRIADIVSDNKFGEEIAILFRDKYAKGESLEAYEIYESRTVQLKRKYRDRPAIIAGKRAPIRESILNHVKECGGTISKSDLKEFINMANENEGHKTSFRWVRENSKYLKYSPKNETYSLTEMGRLVLSKTSINEEIPTDVIIKESYDGDIDDFKYEIRMAIENLGLSPDAIKSVKKNGDTFKVAMSSYMKDESLWKKLADELGAELVSFDKGNTNYGQFK